MHPSIIMASHDCNRCMVTSKLNVNRPEIVKVSSKPGTTHWYYIYFDERITSDITVTGNFYKDHIGVNFVNQNTSID